MKSRFVSLFHIVLYSKKNKTIESPGKYLRCLKVAISFAERFSRQLVYAELFRYLIIEKHTEILRDKNDYLLRLIND